MLHWLVWIHDDRECPGAFLWQEREPYDCMPIISAGKTRSRFGNVLDFIYSLFNAVEIFIDALNLTLNACTVVLKLTRFEGVDEEKIMQKQDVSIVISTSISCART
jgi:hypothetical protein